MKASIIALAASSLLGGATASAHHGHAHFHAKKDAGYINVIERGAEAENATCACEIKTTTIYGSMTLQPQPPPAPTPLVSTWSTPGTYTVVSSTVTLTETTTVASASVATLTPGTCTYGGYTTSVPTPCTITVPVGTVSGSGVATTSVVVTSTHTCSEAGVCVVGGTTTSVSVSTISVYPVPATYSPGTYTVPGTTVTVTETGTVYVCPFSSVTPPPTSSAAPPPSSTPAAPVKAASAPSWSAAPSPPAKPSGEGYIGSGPAPSSSSSAPSSSPSSSSSGSIGGTGNKWAMSYTPYTSTGDCKTADEVSSDIADIAGKGFSSVRLYATDCSGLQNVGSACAANGMKLIVGIFIDESGIGAAAEQVSQITSWGQWDTVELVVVGNEAIFNEYCTGAELAAFILTTKTALKAAGYSGPVTTTEPLGTLQANTATICPVVDVVAANIQPFFNGAVTASDAGSFVASQLQLTGEQCPGKDAYNLECGWPSSGSANGVAVPGSSQQHAAISGVLGSSAASRSVIFSYQNDGWKAPGEWGVEQFFGVADILAGV